MQGGAVERILSAAFRRRSAFLSHVRLVRIELLAGVAIEVGLHNLRTLKFHNLVREK